VVISVALLSQKKLYYFMLEGLECLIFPFTYVCVLGSIIAIILHILCKYITWLYIKTSYCWCFQDTSQSFLIFCRIERLFCCQKKKFLVLFLRSIVVQLETAMYSFIYKFRFWHGLLNPYLLFHGAVWWHHAVTVVTFLNLTHCTSRCTTSSV